MAKVISVLAPTPHQRDKYLNRLFKENEKLDLLDISFFSLEKGHEHIQYLQMFANNKEAFLRATERYNQLIEIFKTNKAKIVILTPSPFEIGLMYSKVALWTHKPTTMLESNVTFDLDACFYFAEHRGGIFDLGFDKDVTSLDYKLRAYKTKLTHLLEKASHYNIPLVKIKGNNKYKKFVNELGKLS